MDRRQGDDFATRLEKAGHHHAAASYRDYQAAREYFRMSATSVKSFMHGRSPGTDPSDWSVGKVIEETMVVLWKKAKGEL